MSEEYTVDELAQDASIPTSTVRMYQNRGLLAPPTKRGRVGIYDSSHRSRLSLIASLQDRGFSLAAIKDVVDNWEKGKSLHELLSVGEAVPALRPEPTRMPLTEITERFAPAPITQEDLQRSVQLGLIEIEGTDVISPDPAFLEVGSLLSELGISTSDIITEYEEMMPKVDDIVRRFQSVFDQHIWSEFVDQGQPEDQLPEIADKVGKLAHAANKILTATVNREFARLADEYLEQARSDS